VRKRVMTFTGMEVCGISVAFTVSEEGG
jgi:hypothetical protein